VAKAIRDEGHKGLRRKRSDMNIQDKPVIISSTGEVHGWGRHPYKWVSRLTPSERTAVQDGALVVVERGASTHSGHPPYRKVVYSWGRYRHRVPTGLEQATINQAIYSKTKGGPQ